MFKEKLFNQEDEIVFVGDYLMLAENQTDLVSIGQ